MSYSLEEKVKHFAIVSRIGIIILQFLTNVLIPDHDAKVFQKPVDPNTTKTYLDEVIDVALGGLTRWDGQYFLHVAEYGYTYENTLAFFPLFPLIIRQLSYFALFAFDFVSSVVKDVISTHTALILVSVLFNNVIFVKTSLVLFRLSLVVLKSEKLAYISAVLFCVNPASVFFSASYSESLYCFLVFYGLLKIEEKNALVNYLIVGLTGAVRSNGLINVGFLLYKYIKLRSRGKIPFLYYIIFSFGLTLTVLPFLSYQFYCYAKFCLPNKVVLPEFIHNHGVSNGFVFPGSNSSWCSQLIPFAYAYVQKHYWNVGFLNYYQLKQIPNFLLASPMIFIMARGCWSFVKRHKHLVLYLGLVDGEHGDELPISAFPYVAHGTALTLFGIFMVHIQVVTRLLASSSPLPYWYCARAIASELTAPVETNVLGKLKKNECFHESFRNKKSAWRSFLFTENLTGFSFFVKWYCLVYFFVGTLMFSNYLPWT